VVVDFSGGDMCWWAEVRHLFSEFPQLNDLRRSWRSDEWRGAELVKFFGNWRLNEISQLSIEKYKRQRLEGLTIRKHREARHQ